VFTIKLKNMIKAARLDDSFSQGKIDKIPRALS